MSILFITQQKYDHINFMAIDTSFEHYAVSHDKNGSGGGSTVIRGNIKNTNIPSDLQVTSITAARGNINNLHGTSESFNDAEFVYLTTSEGKILKIKGDELNYTIGSIDELKSGKITTDNIKSNDLYSTNAVIDALNSTNITTEYLTVTKQAHFFELVIDKVKSVGGSLIITGANSVIAYVKAFDSNNVEVPMFDSNGDPIAESTIDNAAAYFKVYWIGKDENTGRENEDEWYIGDQAYCQSFNVHEGTNFNASNKYYWRKVIDHESPVYMNLKTGEELQSGQSELYNEVYINTPTLSYTVDGTTYNVNKGWNVAVQQMSEVTWTPDSSVIDGTTCGTMGTKGTTFGIQLTPNTSTGSIQNIVPETFSFTCDKARLGVGFVYQDGTYEWFAAPEQGQTSYTFSLTTSTPIDAIIIINNDTVEWKLVRGIRLSNTIKDSNLAGAASIPSIGDNIAQLGHRYDEKDSELGQDTAAARERASAIIIAAYHTPDKEYGTPGQPDYVRGLTPPSYAQYKLIKTFELSKYRHTFFDAKGSAFYGDFYAGSDNSGYNELEAGTPELFVAYAEDDGHGHADPNHWTKTPDINVTYDFMGYATATVPPGGTRAAVEQTLQFSNYDWSMVPSATSTNGINGSYTQYAYKNAVSAPSTPSSTSTYPPTGWTKTASTPSDGQYTWCIERTIVYDTNNTIDYTQCPWSSAYRISGSNGQQGPQGSNGQQGPQGTDGSDGTDFEFIYTRNDDGTVPTAPVYDSNNNPVNTQDDWHGTDSHGIVWEDHPMGVQSDLKYEFMVQRSKPAGQQTWNAYVPNQAALWSKYGENGRDGDGIEYIYACASDTQAANIPAIITNSSDLQDLVSDLIQIGNQGVITAWKPYQLAEWKYVTNNEYLPPSKRTYHYAGGNYKVAGYYPDTDWTDDPQELNATDKKVEYVAQRKYNGSTKTWDNFSTPEIWAMYGGTGPQGPQGNPGPQGANGTDYKLVNNGSIASYGVTLNSDNEEVVSLTASFSYKIANITNGNVHYLTSQERQNFPKPGGGYYLFYPYVRVNDTTLQTSAIRWYKLSGSNETCSRTFNFRSLSASEKKTFIDSNPTFEIALILIDRPEYPDTAPDYLDPSTYATEINNALDRQEIKNTMSSSAQFQIVQGDETNAPSIKALVTGQLGLSELIIGEHGIQSQVNSLGNEVSGMQSTVDQMPDQILSQVVRTYNNAQGLGDPTQVDLTSLDETKWYPVTIGLNSKLYDSGSFISGSEGFEQRIQIRRQLNSEYGAPGYADNTDGFVLCLDFSTVAHGDIQNGIETWDYNVNLNRNGEPLVINKYEVDYTSTQYSSVSGDNIDAKAICSVPIQNNYGCWRTVLGSLRQIPNCNDEIVYLRGGSKYDIYMSDQNGEDIDAVVWTSGYAKSSGTPTFNYPVITNWHSLNIAEQDMMPRSEIKQTVDSIELNVYDTIYEKTGIDIERGKISLNANDTSVNGGLMTVNTGSGIVWTDQNGTPKINIHAGDLTGLPTEITNNIAYDSEGVNMINLPYNTSQRTGTITYEWILETNYNMLGKLPEGATISVSGMNARIGIGVGRWDYVNTSPNYVQAKLELLYDSTIIATDTKNFRQLSAQSGTVNHSTLSTTVTQGQTSGVWKVRATIDLNNANINISSISGANMFVKLTGGSYTVNFSGASSTYSALEMGNNGIDFATSGSNRLKFKDDEFLLQTSKYSGIKINSDNKIPVQRHIGGSNYETPTDNWSALGTQMRVNGSANSAIIANFSFDTYVITSGGRDSKIIITGDACSRGRILYIMCEKSTTINTSTGQNTNKGVKIIDTNGNQQSSINISPGLHVLMCYGMNDNDWILGCTF